MSAYYNEIDPFAAAWLRELIKRGLIAPGDVDERDIRDVQPADLEPYTQCHFFAGIGGWSYALRLAGWPDDRPVWTGSCPCQPFSAAGSQKGFSDPRHLWPEWYRLIRECQPVVLFGEQVASSSLWLDLVSGDLENQGYAFGSAVLGAHSVGAPHIRQRLYFVADSKHAFGRKVMSGDERNGRNGGWSEAHSEPRACGEVSRLDNSPNPRRNDTREHGSRSPLQTARPEQRGSSCVALGDTSCERLQERKRIGRIQLSEMESSARQAFERAGYVSGFWQNADWLYCRDEKFRPVESGTFPLAHGVPARVGRLRGYGNAIVPQVAQTFIESYLDVCA